MNCISKRALLGDEKCIELRDRSHLCYKSIINYDLDITKILVISPQIRYIEVFDVTNSPFNEQIWPVPGGFVKSRFRNGGSGRHCDFHCLLNIFLSFINVLAKGRMLNVYSVKSEAMLLM